VVKERGDGLLKQIRMQARLSSVQCQRRRDRKRCGS